MYKYEWIKDAVTHVGMNELYFSNFKIWPSLIPDHSYF